MKTHLLLAVILAAVQSVLVAESIGINFLSDREASAELGADELAGVPEVAQVNWNNTTGGTDAQAGAGGSEADVASPSAGELVDSTGASSGVAVTWTSNGTWNTTNGTGTPDAKLMNGYIDNIGDAGFATIDFAGIPYANYDVYVYFGSDGNDRTGSVESTTAGQEFFYATSSNDPNGGGGFDPATDYALTDAEVGPGPPSNYCVFVDQTSSDFSVQINRGSSNSGFHGIQIVSKAPPEDGDEDGLPDAWETANGLSPEDDGTGDPNNGASGDPDMDGSSNLEEFERGTDPQNEDSDGDGLDDGAETLTGTFVDADDTGTNPVNRDTDGDGLLDGDEVAANPYVSDPNKADTDGDGFDDATEVENDSDPSDPDDRPEFGGGARIGINFNSNRDLAAELAPPELAGVAEVAQINWNNTAGGADAAAGASGTEADIIGPTAGVLVDESGSPSGVSVTWASNGTWNTTNGNAVADAKLMNGYIDNIGGDGFATVEFTGITYTTYDVFVYFGSDGNDRTGSIESTTAGQEFFFTTFSNDPNGGGGFDPATDYVLTEDEAGTNPNSNYCVFREQTAADFSVQVNRGSSNSGIHAIQIVGTNLAPDELRILDVNHDEAAGTTELTWESSEGEVFDVRKSFDLTGDPSTWPVVLAEVSAADAPAETTTAVVDTNATEPEAFYKVFQIPPPPVFQDDFETDRGWTTGVNDDNGDTLWERGAPTNVGPASGADGSTNCFGTNIAADYGLNADIFLRSPEIDLTAPGTTGVRLSFQQFKDIEVGFDLGSVRVLRAGDGVQLGADVAAVIDGVSADWENFSANLPPEAIGETILLEFQFTSDELEAFGGWYIDNVVLTRQ